MDDDDRFSVMLSWIARPPTQIFSSIVRNDNLTISRVTAHVEPRPSSMGALGVLPLEILHEIFGELDFLSLFRLRRVSYCSKEVVESLPSYVDVMRYAPPALKACAIIGVLDLHSASKLQTALRSSACVSCLDFGPFLFLPTCERCCYTCLSHNPSLWVIPEILARLYFGLTADEVQQLPTINRLRRPPIRPALTLSWRLRGASGFVSVKMAKELKIKLHGEAFDFPDDSSVVDELAEENIDPAKIKLYQNAPLGPQPQFSMTCHTNPDPIRDDYAGAACVLFPHLFPDRTTDHGIWCQGCNWLQYAENMLSDEVKEKLSVPNVELRAVLRRLAFLARPKKEWHEHLSSCFGIPLLRIGGWKS